MFGKYNDTILNMNHVIKVTSTYKTKYGSKKQEEAVCVGHDNGTSTTIAPMTIDKFNLHIERNK